MGLDTDQFIGEVPEYLMCPICLEVLEDPQQMCESQHVACDGCLSDYFGIDVNKKKPCPVCREFFTWQSLTTSRILERALMTLKVKCANSAECAWVGSYKDSEDHSKKSCLFYEVPCENCGDEVAVSKKEDHLRSSCGGTMIDCPRGGAQCGSYYRRNTADHNGVCCNYECSVDEECHTRTTLENLHLHERECRNIRDQLRDSRRKISALEESLARTQDQLNHEARKKVEELERAVAELNVENSRLKSRLTGQPSS